MDTSMQQFQTLLSEADACLTRINQALDKAIAANAGAQPVHKLLHDCHDENNACSRKHKEQETWRIEHEAEFHAAPPDPGPDPNPPVTGLPVDPIPADGMNRKFAPFPANQKVTSHAGGAGRFTFTTPAGSAYYKVWVNGTPTVDGPSMDYSYVNAGDQIDWMITSPAMQDECTYTLQP